MAVLLTACGTSAAPTANSGGSGSTGTPTTTVIGNYVLWPVVGQSVDGSAVLEPPPTDYGTWGCASALGGQTTTTTSNPDEVICANLASPTSVTTLYTPYCESESVTLGLNVGGSFPAGSPVLITATLTNDGSASCYVNLYKTSVLVFNTSNGDLVWSNSGEPAPEDTGTEQFVPQSVAPGETIDLPVDYPQRGAASWNGQTCVKDGVCTSGPNAPAGTYEVVANWVLIGAIAADLTLT